MLEEEKEEEKGTETATGGAEVRWLELLIGTLHCKSPWSRLFYQKSSGRSGISTKARGPEGNEL